jgi:hypothetical protein
MRIEKGWGLSDQQYNDAPEKLKWEYIKMRIEGRWGLSDHQYNDAPEKLKLSYLEKQIEIGYQKYFTPIQTSDYHRLKK